MVGKRHTQNGDAGNPRGAGRNSSRDNDLESGFAGERRRKYSRFRDVVQHVVTDKSAAVLKQQLKMSVDREKYDKYRKDEKEIKDMKNKKLREYYTEQNERLDDWLEVDTLVDAMAEEVIDSMNPDPDNDGDIDREGGLQRLGNKVSDLLPADVREQRAKGERNARWAININVIANILLLAAKGAAAMQSSSLSLIASLLDSALDLLCTLIVFTTNKLVAWRLSSLKTRFPVGRRRLEPLGILVFSIIMIISFLQILQESVEKLMPGGEKETTALPPVAIGALAATVIVKGIIGLGCMKIKTTQVQALAQDCKTDVIFNTLSLAFPLIGHYADVWWLDPAGAAVLSLFIVYDWAGTMFENVFRLSGCAIEERLQRKLTFLAYRFSPVVKGFKKITAYHAGDKVWVEYDVLLDEKTPLQRAHDVGETLQYCAEGLDEVDRAFVSMDYSIRGPEGHAGDNTGD